MSLATNSNINRTSVTIRSVNPAIAKFLSTQDEAQILLVSSSNLPSSNILYIANKASTKELYLGINNPDRSIHRLATFTNSNIILPAPLSIQGDLSATTEAPHDLGSPTHKWRNIYLNGNIIQLDTAQINYELPDEDCVCSAISDISFLDTRTNEYLTIVAESLKINNPDNYYSILSTGPSGAIISSYTPDDVLINSINIGQGTTSILPEGTSNLYLTEERIRAVAAQLNIGSSVIQEETSNILVALITNTSNQIYQYIKQTEVNILGNTSNASNFINHIIFASNLETSNAITSMYTSLSSNITSSSNSILREISTANSNILNYITNTSNTFTSNISTTSNVLATQINTTTSNTNKYISDTSNALSSNIYASSNEILRLINRTVLNASNYTSRMQSNVISILSSTSNEISSNLRFLANNMSNQASNEERILTNYITTSSNAIIRQIITLDTNISNYISITSNTYATMLITTSNTLAQTINNLTTDQIKADPTNSKKFIVNGVYDGDLTTSNLTVIGNIKPASHLTYNLGSSTKKWRHVYLSSNSIYLGNSIVLSSDPVSKGLRVQDNAGNLAEIVTSSIKLLDSTGEIQVLRSVNNSLNIGGISENVDPNKKLNSDEIIETGRLFYRSDRVATVAIASNLESSNYTSNMFVTISNRLANLTTNDIKLGTSNQFIVNGTFNSNLLILGTLTTSNLNVIGAETYISTRTFKTDNLEILAQTYTGPALEVIQRGTQNIAEFLNSNTPVVVIKNDGKVGIGTTDPTVALDVRGSIRFTGRLNTVSSNELSYISDVACNIQKQIDDTLTYTSNYTTNINEQLNANLTATSNAIAQHLTSLDTSQSNLIGAVATWMQTLISSSSNDIIINNLNPTNTTTSNMIRDTYNSFTANIQSTSNTLSSRITTLNNNMSNLIDTLYNVTGLRSQILNNSNTLANKLRGVLAREWQVATYTGSNVVYIQNSNVGIGTADPKVALDVVGNIKLTGGTINSITTTELEYLRDLRDNVQNQIDTTSNLTSNYVRTSSSNLFESLRNMTSNVNSNISAYDIATSNHITTTFYTQLNDSDLAGMSSTIGNRIDRINFTQWTPTADLKTIYYPNKVAIGSTTLSANSDLNALEISGGDLLLSSTDGIDRNIYSRIAGVTEKYQLERWVDCADYNNVNPKFIYYNEGKVGICNTNPQTNLHVGTTTSAASGGITSSSGSLTGYYFSGTQTSTTLSGVSSFILSARFESSILVANGGSVVASSDARIKKNILDIEDDSALQKILAIQPKTYNYIDPFKGTAKVYGFSAQQIKSVIPEAVPLVKGVIPNIFCTADCSLNVITFDHDISVYNLQPVTSRVSIIDMKGMQDTYNIISTNLEAQSITISKNIEGNKVFVYGTEIDDFHALDKSYIFTLNVCATQKISEKVDNLTNRIAYIEYLKRQVS